MTFCEESGISFGKFTKLQDKDLAVRTKIAYVLNQTQQMFEYNGLPDTIKKRDAELLIQTRGYGCVLPVNGKVYCIFGALGGQLDQNYMPTIATIANPYLKYNATLKVDEECIIIPNDHLYQGLIPQLERYCSLIAEGELTLRMMNIMARQQRGIVCPDDDTLKSALAYLEGLEAGEIGVLADSGIDMLDKIQALPGESIGGNAITQIIEGIQYQAANISKFIGLDDIFNMKKEAINEAEAAIGGSLLLPFPQNMLECRQDGWEKVNQLFGTNI